MGKGDGWTVMTGAEGLFSRPYVIHGCDYVNYLVGEYPDLIPTDGRWFGASALLEARMRVLRELDGCARCLSESAASAKARKLVRTLDAVMRLIGVCDVAQTRYVARHLLTHYGERIGFGDNVRIRIVGHKLKKLRSPISCMATKCHT